MSNNREDAELRRIESEILRNNAEKTKFLSESTEINNKNKLWKVVLKSIVSGIVFASLLAAWIIGYLLPITQKDNIENQILAARNEVGRLELDSLKHVFNIQRDTLVKQISILISQVNRSKELIKQKELTETEKIKQINDLNEEIEKLNTTKQKIENTKEKFSRSRISSMLVGKTWDVTFEGSKLKSMIWRFEANGILNDGTSHSTWQINDDGTVTIKLNGGEVVCSISFGESFIGPEYMLVTVRTFPQKYIIKGEKLGVFLKVKED
jgi:hypothetical protein